MGQAKHYTQYMYTIFEELILITRYVYLELSFDNNTVDISPNQKQAEAVLGA